MLDFCTLFISHLGEWSSKFHVDENAAASIRAKLEIESIPSDLCYVASEMNDKFNKPTNVATAVLKWDSICHLNACFTAQKIVDSIEN